MALEQSIVMGIALAWLFVRALAESEATSSAPSATRRKRPGAMPKAGDRGVDGQCFPIARTAHHRY